MLHSHTLMTRSSNVNREHQFIILTSLMFSQHAVCLLGTLASPVAAASVWGPSAVAALVEMWDRQNGVAGQTELMQVVSSHIGVLPSGSQPLLARQLMPMVAKLPFAADRTAALAKVCTAPQALVFSCMPGMGDMLSTPAT